MLDKNKTVWQRLADAIQEAVPDLDTRKVQDLTAKLHPHVIAERLDSKSKI